MVKILVLEAEAALVLELSKRLSDSGYTVITSGDGDNGYAKVKAESPDLVVLDSVLQGIDGITLCHLLRLDPITAPIPIIMLSASDNESDVVTALDSGADDYIIKPLGVESFLARVRAVLRRTWNLPIVSGEIVSANICLNLDTKTLLKDNQPVRLSEQEFRVLVELMKNKGKAISREAILSVVRGDRDKRGVDIYIRWLREKIEIDPANPVLIETVREIGYRYSGSIQYRLPPVPTDSGH